MNRVISPNGAGWTAGEALSEAISAWEGAAGVALPADYRRFMTRYNGGYPYPNMFLHTALTPGAGCANPAEHFCDPLYTWERTLTWSAELGDRLPPGCLSIGSDPGLIEIVLSRHPEDFGAVYSWLRNHGIWGSAENSYICPQAPSFAGFLAGLFDNEERHG